VNGKKSLGWRLPLITGALLLDSSESILRVWNVHMPSMPETRAAQLDDYFWTLLGETISSNRSGPEAPFSVYFCGHELRSANLVENGLCLEEPKYQGRALTLSQLSAFATHVSERLFETNQKPTPSQSGTHAALHV
jgi:hypothetical protein